ncbi:PTS fructose transporter subunit IIA [Candidatus Methylopumilus universalis]|jgi:PTS system ascorbate-specific IIA component|uniref:PTS fructose transporter subunit IIA n=1 Tax=Candidatus Methylopumilus universalis TaxID=2588536 RepID=A0ABX5VTD9_9PROT|nr:PTS fructose transporter subunit IIA [Candidatus Methylopumilus universalis]QDC45557.1 PTS fructose transporter subunit IIA [Candidatus Methylopumilus universalis]QDC50571.1 PTS fructose transporter subunit IIA [Candidatus Methylopumilus universalis]QDC60705.1 PTS fructose transporter subunit IIA [Candidatus Methylopumilus universalis]QDC70091.1 PTS fructose transporter subunit IIA [Candidatus Methylopumilus universalis]QDC98455.1 PTS fructose transporter subunit IIA [Candidatus Methylopumi
MISILLITHGELGKSLIECATHVLGDKPLFLESLSIENDCTHESMFRQISERINLLDQGDGVLILTDIFGATPCNIITKIIKPGKVSAIAGVNLSMLIRTINYRNEPFDSLISKAIQGAQDGIIHIQGNQSC